MSFTTALFKQIVDAVGPGLVETRDSLPADVRECVGEISASMTADVVIAGHGSQRVRVTVALNPDETNRDGETG